MKELYHNDPTLSFNKTTKGKFSMSAKTKTNFFSLSLNNNYEKLSLTDVSYNLQMIKFRFKWNEDVPCIALCSSSGLLKPLALTFPNHLKSFTNNFQSLDYQIIS